MKQKAKVIKLKKNVRKCHEKQIFLKIIHFLDIEMTNEPNLAVIYPKESMP